MPLWPRASLLQGAARAAVAPFRFIELIPAADAAAAATDAARGTTTMEPDSAAVAAGDAIAAAELARIREEAYAEGHAAGRVEAWTEGHATGLEEGRVEGEQAEQARLHHAVEAVERALAQIKAATAPWVDTAEENVAALAVAVARQILDREVRGSSAAFAELVRRALAEFPVDERVRIRLNPSDLAAITAMPGPDNEPFSVTGGREAAWVADTAVGAGGCLVEGRTRIIDGRVDVALERVYRRLTGTHA